jgi:hypothetical protein
VISFLQRFVPELCIHFSSLSASCAAHLNLHHLIALIMLDEEYKLQSLSVSFSCVLLFHPSLGQIFSAPSTQTPVVLFSSLNVRDQVPHLYKTTGKFIMLCIFIMMFLGR